MEHVIALGLFEALTTRQKWGIGAGVGGVGLAGRYGYNKFQQMRQQRANRASDSAMGDLDKGQISKPSPRYPRPEAPTVPARQVGGSNISGLRRAEANIPKPGAPNPENLSWGEQIIKKVLQTKLDLGTKVLGNITGHQLDIK